MPTFKILEQSDREEYLEHIKANYKNSRVFDPLLLDKVTESFESTKNDRIIIFAILDDSGKIRTSMLTSKRVLAAEYFIVNYRTSGGSFFRKKDFLDLFAHVFAYYENIGYYRWLLIRQIDMFGKSFHGIGEVFPFNKYETAIEYAPKVSTNLNFYYHAALLNGIPDATSPENFILMAGFCKQEHRKIFNDLNFI